jgi:hypothetical protein
MVTGIIVELYGKASRNIYSLMNAGHDVYCLMCAWQGKAFMKGGVCPSATPWQDIA